MGHKYLLDFAAQWCGSPALSIVVCSRSDEPIPGALRWEALREAYGHRAAVIHLEHQLPHTPEESPSFWDDWRIALQQAAGTAKFDHVFASEVYGTRLAQEFGARFIPVNIGRRTVQISASIIRESIAENWDYILPEFRQHFVRRVAIVGPESCGKTELCRDLARHFNTEWCPEWARMFLEAEGHRYPVDADYPLIAKAHACAEDALAKQATRVLISDTDAVCTRIAAERLNGYRDAYVDELARTRHYDLRIVVGDDVPFAADPLRFGKDQRQFTTAEFEEAYRALGAPFITIRGPWESRFQQAVNAIRALLRDRERSIA